MRSKKIKNGRLILVNILAMMFLVSNKGVYAMQLSSPAFKNNESIPREYTCLGEDINPPFNITALPPDCKSLALIIDDPDAPAGTWVHWVVYNIPPKNFIEENSVPGDQGLNDFGRIEYGGPCPPSGTHRYFFKLYALDKTIPFEKNMTKENLEVAMSGHIIAKSHLIGLFHK